VKRGAGKEREEMEESKRKKKGNLGSYGWEPLADYRAKREKAEPLVSEYKCCG
jgi:hypothetical protein